MGGRPRRALPHSLACAAPTRAFPPTSRKYRARTGARPKPGLPVDRIVSPPGRAGRDAVSIDSPPHVISDKKYKQGRQVTDHVQITPDWKPAVRPSPVRGRRSEGGTPLQPACCASIPARCGSASVGEVRQKSGRRLKNCPDVSGARAAPRTGRQPARPALFMGSNRCNPREERPEPIRQIKIPLRHGGHLLCQKKQTGGPS